MTVLNRLAFAFREGFCSAGFDRGDAAKVSPKYGSDGVYARSVPDTCRLRRSGERNGDPSSGRG